MQARTGTKNAWTFQTEQSNTPGSYGGMPVGEADDRTPTKPDPHTAIQRGTETKRGLQRGTAMIAVPLTVQPPYTTVPPTAKLSLFKHSAPSPAQSHL